MRQADDPVSECIVEGAELGFLGLALHNRRRNRVNGRVVRGAENQVTVKVSQSFGNCPKYIQKRIFAPSELQEKKSPVRAEIRSAFSAEDLHMIEQVDTFFIASIAARPGENAKRGVDVSHRGGKPGFVKATPDGRLIIPDFAGNNHFNTLGNIHETGKAGLLFLDFKTGDILQATGAATLLWPEESEWNYGGAERYLVFDVEQVVRRDSTFPLGWYYIDASPFIPDGGPWLKV
ncbi:MAG: pyridoxamine 5'-phosphate oxidase family protein [Alphaproteobacteria bacterium]|nr:pyridoxamine 5'-phosphate oxidase family protein [Alphaproteobacteria bacterium]